MNSRPLLPIAAALALLAGAAGAQQPLPGFQPDRVFADATHVVVFELTEDERVGAARPDGSRAPWTLRGEVVATLQDDGVPLPFRLEVEATTLLRPFDGGTGFLPLAAGDTLLAFLRLEDGRPTLAHPNHGLLRVSHLRAAARHPTPRDAVLAELRAATADPSPEVLVGALQALAGFVDLQALSAARTLSASADPHVAAAAFALRFRLGDGSALVPAAGLVTGDSTLSAGERDLLAWSATAAEATLDRALLERLLAGDHATLRTVAADVLSRTALPENIPALLRGLDAPERETQYRCVVGLCRLTSTPGPGRAEFLADPEPTLRAWKARVDRRQRRRGR